MVRLLTLFLTLMAFEAQAKNKNREIKIIKSVKIEKISLSPGNIYINLSDRSFCDGKYKLVYYSYEHTGYLNFVSALAKKGNMIDIEFELYKNSCNIKNLEATYQNKIELY